MKIAILPVNGQFQPPKTIRLYPSHAPDYGVEQDFLVWLNNHPEILTDDLEQASWHYLPVFWTRWYYNHDYGRQSGDELQMECDRVIADDRKTFTICQYAGGVQQKIGNTIQFQSSPFKKTPFLIPELSFHPGLPLIKPPKKYKASFVGRISTHPARAELMNFLRDEPDVFFYNGNKGIHFYTQMMLKSYISLCPRGKGMGSFRLYESLFSGITPLVYGEFDNRPFSKWINWDNFSFFSNNLDDCLRIIRNVAPDTLIGMGKIAELVYGMHLDFQRWCKFVLMELDDISPKQNKVTHKSLYPYIDYYQVKWQGTPSLKIRQKSLSAGKLYKFLYKLYKKSGFRNIFKMKG